MTAAPIRFKIDGQEIEARVGQTILQAAEDAGIYIPRLCSEPSLTPHGSCRVCSVRVNGRVQSSCTQPVTEGLEVEHEVPDIQQLRKNIIEMLFVEGNHFCMICEKSGNCELQALGYRFGMTHPKYPYMYPERDVDASHPDVYLDHNRCILCARCIRASLELDGKNVFQFAGRGIHKRIAVHPQFSAAGAGLDVADRAAEICPVGCILVKGRGFETPIGQRAYDHEPIGHEIETKEGGS